MRSLLVFVFLLALASPVLAAPATGSPSAPAPDLGADRAVAPSDADAWTWALSDSESMVESVLPQDVGATSGCSAFTTCANGSISCTGQTSCVTEPHCFVFCDGYFQRCNNPCP